LLLTHLLAAGEILANQVLIAGEVEPRTLQQRRVLGARRLPLKKLSLIKEADR
jgi:hypothetical protein